MNAMLTSQQKRVLEQIWREKLDKEIADTLAMSEWTVRFHLRAIFKKLNVRNRVGAALFFERELQELAGRQKEFNV